MSPLLSDKRSARWAVLLIVSLTMLFGYFLNDAMAPLMTVLQSDMGWTAGDYGFFNSSYSWLNVFCLMLIFGGIILDKMGARFTGTLACALMVIGAVVKYIAVQYVAPPSADPGNIVFLGHHRQVIIACIGFAVFAMGYEMCGITVSKVIAKWFKGHEMALAMGTQVALCRVGSFSAMFFSPMIARRWQMSSPLLLSCVLLMVALLAYLVFNVMDSRLDRQLQERRLQMADATPEEGKRADDDSFRLSDLKAIFTSRSFWLIALFCLIFYSSVKPFNKFSTSLMINKYGFAADSWFVNFVPSLLHLCSLCLTPAFGWLYDKKGKGSRFLIVGCCVLTLSLTLFALPILPHQWFAVVVMVLLGVAYSLVPAVFWPIIPKVIPHRRLGTGYSVIFWIQNIGLSYVPLLIGVVLDRWCVTGMKDGAPSYDYTLPMCIFVVLALTSIFLATRIRRDDSKKHYGIEEPNIK
ncbi:MAG: MFS transporter [Bacteroidaceae bacterium]|nr:MFS transporter [Bacteroidaceae bacterium]